MVSRVIESLSRLLPSRWLTQPWTSTLGTHKSHAKSHTLRLRIARLKVIAAVLLKIHVLWAVRRVKLLAVTDISNDRSTGSNTPAFLNCLNLKMEAVGHFETLVTINSLTRRNVPKELNLPFLLLLHNNQGVPWPFVRVLTDFVHYLELSNLHSSAAGCLEIWEPQHPAALKACPAL